MKKSINKALSTNFRKFEKAYKAIKRITRPFDKVEVEAYAAHFYDYLKIHQRYIKTNAYNEFWQIFQAMKDGRIKEPVKNQEASGQYGLHLISMILYSEHDDLELIERLVALNSLLGFISGKKEE